MTTIGHEDLAELGTQAQSCALCAAALVEETPHCPRCGLPIHAVVQGLGSIATLATSLVTLALCCLPLALMDSQYGVTTATTAAGGGFLDSFVSATDAIYRTYLIPFAPATAGFVAGLAAAWTRIEDTSFVRRFAIVGVATAALGACVYVWVGRCGGTLLGEGFAFGRDIGAGFAFGAPFIGGVIGTTMWKRGPQELLLSLPRIVDASHWLRYPLAALVATLMFGLAHGAVYVTILLVLIAIVVVIILAVIRGILEAILSDRRPASTVVFYDDEGDVDVAYHSVRSDERGKPGKPVLTTREKPGFIAGLFGAGKGDLVTRDAQGNEVARSTTTGGGFLSGPKDATVTTNAELTVDQLAVLMQGAAKGEVRTEGGELVRTVATHGSFFGSDERVVVQDTEGTALGAATMSREGQHKVVREENHD